MHNFVSVMECLNSPNTECALSPPSLILYVAIAALVVMGWQLARRDHALFRSRIRRWLLIGIGVMAVSFVAVLGFFLLDPDPVLGVEGNPVSQGLWLLAINAFGVGLMIVLGMIGFWPGGRASRLAGGTEGGN
jgi:hypothetical protein